MYEIIDDVAVGEIRKKIRQILGSFLFSGDDADKKVKVLSGGEKTRLALCKLLFEPYNFLILDEPTNHLDIVSKEILKEALESYTGTLIIVSHDRDFLDGLTEKVFYIKNKSVKVYYEGLKQFIKSYYEASDVFAEKLNKKKENKKPEGKKIKELSKQIKSVERKIDQLEAEHQQLQQKINENAFPHDQLQDKIQKMNELKGKVEKKYEEWSELSKLLEA